MILCLRRTWETLQQFSKKKVQMGMIAVFTWAAIELASSLALHCPGRRSGQDNGKNGRSDSKISIFSKALSEVLERSFAKNSRPIKYETNKTRFMEETLVVPRNHLETQSLKWWNIW
jgi:hypothetical protein